jgi:hypothetical protein
LELKLRISKRRLAILIPAIVLPAVLVIVTTHAVAASPDPGRSAPALIEDPIGVAGLVFDWSYTGDQQGAQFGTSVGTAGDVNGDGYDDVIIGASIYSYSGTTSYEGAAFVFYGSASGGLSDTPDWLVGGDQQGARFGASVGTAGDVNGDGCDDVIVGAPSYDVGERETGGDAGRAYVFYGCWEAGNGLSTSPNWILDGEGRDANFGMSVGTAGDVDGDAYEDVIVGSPGYHNGQARVGKAYVFLGFETGQTTTLFWPAEGDQAAADFGAAVGTIGDVNGDGYDDVIVGAPQYDNGEQDEGVAFVYLGSGEAMSSTYWLLEIDQPRAGFGTSVRTAGDVNGDDYDDVIVGAPVYSDTTGSVGGAFAYYGSASGLSITPTWTLLGDRPGSEFGTSVGTAGDVNKDGYDDVIIGAPQYELDQEDPGFQKEEGFAFVFVGSASGLSEVVYWSGEGNKQGTDFGYSAGTAGDVNGDGCADVIVGAPQYMSASKTLLGRVFVYHGGEDPVYYYIYLPLTLRGS